MVAISEQLNDRTFKIDHLVEKPGAEETPSSYASVGGYLLTPDILPILAEEQISLRGEIELPEAISRLAQNETVYGRFIEGDYHDTGNPELYLRALVDVALADKTLGPGLGDYLRKKLHE